MLALNSFPGVICGHVEDPVDAYTFAHVNDGNAVALPFAKGFGWGGELNLEYVFEKLFGFGHGQGYPKERVVPEQRNKKILDGVRSVAFRDLCDILKDLDHDLVKGAFTGEHFAEHFFADCKDEKISCNRKGTDGIINQNSFYWGCLCTGNRAGAAPLIAHSKIMRSGRVQRGENIQKSDENWAVKPVKPENVSNLQHNSQIDNKLFVHN